MKTLIILIATLSTLCAHAGNSFFDGVTTKKSKCYSRTYSAEKLAANPNQKVTHMAAKLSKEVYHVDQQGQEHVMSLLKIQAKKRGDSKVYSVEMACVDDGQCYIECDGPRTKIQWSTSKKGSIVIDARREKGNYISLNPLLCGDDISVEEAQAASFALNGIQGGDDLFRLDPIPDFQCL